MTYLATREVYDYLGVPENIGIRNFKMGHAVSARSWYEIVDFSNNGWNNEDPTLGYYKLSASTIEAVTPEDWMDADPKYGPGGHLVDWFDPAATEPGGYHEFLKLKWAAPNKGPENSVGAIVKKYFDDNNIPSRAGPPYNYDPDYVRQ
jgi:hypothetical protein